MAKRQSFMNKEETGFGDPLGDYSEGFNILQFINDNDTPVDSPADPSRFNEPPTQIPNSTHQQLNNNGTIEGTWIHPHPPQAPINNNYGQVMNCVNGLMQNPILVDNGMMFNGNGNTRLPDSPPITDISAGGSSASPSTTSDSPYSPDQYPYLVQQGNVLLGTDANGQQIILSQDLINQQLNGMNGRFMNHHSQHSPNSEFLSPYPPQSTPGSQISQVSPPAVNTSRYIIPQQGQQQGLNNDIYASEATLLGNNMQPPSAKRKRSELPLQQPIIKNECPSQRMYMSDSARGTPSLPMNIPMDDYDENYQQRPIRKENLQFTPYTNEIWSDLYDIHHQPLQNMAVVVVADKGFNHSAADGCYVNQKKNHFQITVHIEVHEDCGPVYFRCDGQLKKIQEFKLAFCGVKAEMPTTEISIRQSQTDRKPVPHEPVSLEIHERRVTKVTVPRLHFSETTLNNHRKNGRPNPEQKYFLLVVKLLAYAADGSCSLIQAYQSEKVIVRASNPAQFEQPDNDATWQRNGPVLHYPGPVAVGTDKQIDNAQLSVMGNIVSTGTYTRPSDRRVKEDIVNIETRDALARLAQVRVVEYAYKPEFAGEWGLDENSRHRVGVIAQELAQVLPDAVRDNGEFLTVDDTRIFYDTVAAAQELYRLTGNLECKIDQVEKISAKLARFAKNKNKQLGASVASGLSDLTLFGRGEDGKSMSYSRTSLASTTTTNCTEKDKKGGKHRSCRSNNSHDLCSSKFTQFTVVGLIGIMALCLLTMCTLYVLDWCRRVNNDPHGPMMSAPTNSQEVIGHLIEKFRPVSYIPQTQPFAPVLASMCGLKSQCPQYCCASSHKYFTSDDISETVDGVVSLSKLSPKPSKVQTKSNSPPSPFTGGISIDIVNLNVSLDQRFCVEKSCQPRNGRFNLYVPISPFLPTIPLHVRFNIKDDKYVDNCGSLRDFAHKTCQFDSTNIGVNKDPTSYMMGENTFELSVGNFIQSAYRFRVGFTTESCNMSEDQQGRSFDEYNIVFYRKCSTNSTMI
jgi:hypothetical protein